MNDPQLEHSIKMAKRKFPRVLHLLVWWETVDDSRPYRGEFVSYENNVITLDHGDELLMIDGKKVVTIAAADKPFCGKRGPESHERPPGGGSTH